MKVSKQRLRIVLPRAQTEQIPVQRIRKFARAAAWFKGVGCTIEERPMHADEVLPGRFIAAGACTRQRKILEVKRVQVTFDVMGCRIAAGKCPFHARLERVCKTIVRHGPPLAGGAPVAAIDQRRVNPRRQLYLEAPDIREPSGDGLHFLEPVEEHCRRIPLAREERFTECCGHRRPNSKRAGTDGPARHVGR
jgi:hypothetical protein